MRRHVVFFILIFLLFTGCSGGGSSTYNATSKYDVDLSLTIVDFADNTPIPGVSVAVPELGVAGYLSDANGKLTIQTTTTSPQLTLNLTHDDYLSKEVIVDPDQYEGAMDIPLVEQGTPRISGSVDFALPSISTNIGYARVQSSTPLQTAIPSPSEIMVEMDVVDEEIARKLRDSLKAASFRILPEIGLIVLKVRPDDNVYALLERAMAHPDVAWAEVSIPVVALGKSVQPNDPEYRKQWHLPATYLDYAWSVTKGSRHVKLAVLDTGVDRSHEDLIRNISDAGYNAITDSLNAYDGNGHGTHVSGIAGADTDNRRGVAGTAWQVEIIPIKVLGDNGVGSDDYIYKGLKKAIELGVDVINMSLGREGEMIESVHKEIESAVQNGIVVVAAAGNSGASTLIFPAAYDEVVAVGALDHFYQVTGYSASSGVRVFAPGGFDNSGIYSTLPGSQYDYMSGTSMAAPIVSGLAALLKVAHPGRDWATELEEYLWKTGTTIESGQRMINAYAAVTESYIENTRLVVVDEDNLSIEIPVDEDRQFTAYLPPGKYKMTAHLAVSGQAEPQSGDWYVEREIEVNGDISDLELRLGILP